MVAREYITIELHAVVLSESESARIGELAGAAGDVGIVFVDLREVDDATAEAMAELFRLRVLMLQSGRDLRLVGLHGRTLDLYERCRKDSQRVVDEPGPAPDSSPLAHSSQGV